MRINWTDRLFLIILLITIRSSNYAQNYELLNHFDITAKSIAVDIFGDFYIVEEFKISKYNRQGVLKFSFENIENGAISNFDISDPLKPLVYFKDFSVLYTLDNKLSIVNEINLFDNELSQIELICQSSNSEYWFFDTQDTKVKKANKSFDVIQESESFISLFEGYNPPKKLRLYNNKIYLLNKTGILIFDYNGVFFKKISISKIDDFQWHQNKIIYFKEGYIYSYDENLLDTIQMKIPKLKGELIDVKVLKNKILILTKKRIHLYTIL